MGHQAQARITVATVITGDPLVTLYESGSYIKGLLLRFQLSRVGCTRTVGAFSTSGKENASVDSFDPFVSSAGIGLAGLLPVACLFLTGVS